MERILIVDDDPLIRKSLLEVLKISGYDVDTIASGKEALDFLKKKNYALVIADLRMPGMDGIELTKEIKKHFPQTEIIIITAYGSVETAIEAMKRGAIDYVLKPINDEEMKIIIEKALFQYRLKMENESLRKNVSSDMRYFNVIGQSKPMQKIFSLLDSIASTNVTVLITGESGTGKRLLAQTIHKKDNNRKFAPFIEVSCGALPETLLESELFGHVKGAFTGALKDKPGRFELADGGTIFLDEIDTLSSNMQVKLLRVLQSREFERVGGTKTIRVDVRIIAASNRDLKKLIQKGEFREDLYYRLNVVTINIPPLRERKDDIPLLAEHFLKKYSAHVNGRVKGISLKAMQALMNYEWPGNVRELENVIERTIILSKNSYIQPEDLPEQISSLPPRSQSTFLLEDLSNFGSYREALQKAERKIIEHVLMLTHGNKKEAAKILRINRTTLYNKLYELGILKKGEK